MALAQHSTATGLCRSWLLVAAELKALC